MKVLLVNEDDQIIRKKDKLETHKLGLLHRAFSIFVFNSKNELLIQKRASTKYHSAGLWSNTCCSHPYSFDIKDEAKKRLQEEMGFSCELKEVFSFIYKSDVGNNLTEHEYDHVFFGWCDETPDPNQNEVSDWRWINLEKLQSDIKKNPKKYTPWLVLSLNRVMEQIRKS